jgi:ADP-ribose pyrophosphatase
MVDHTNDDKLRWKTLSSEYLFDDVWLRARKDRCVRPDGKIIDPYYVIEYPQWATGVGITESNEVVLVKQYRQALQVVCMEIPGGCIDAEDANPEAAIRREFIEETGYTFSSVAYLGKTSPNPSTNANWMHMFLLTGGKLTHPQSLDENEEIEVYVVPMQEFVDMALKGEILQSMHMTTIFFALHKLGKLSISL